MKQYITPHVTPYVTVLVLLALLIVPACGQQAVPESQATETQVVEVTEDASVSVKSSVKSFEVTARNWEFTPEMITVNKGDTVKLSITSEDVDHGFTIPAFDVNERLTPGNTVDVEFVADQTGSFPFICSVYCGSGHKAMKGTLLVK
jgi:cytochrome c oxidase subunit II